MKNLSFLIIALLIYSCSSDNPVSTFNGHYFEIMGVVDSIYAPAGLPPNSAHSSSYLGTLNSTNVDSIVCSFDFSVNNWNNIFYSYLGIHQNLNGPPIINTDTSHFSTELNGMIVLKNLQPNLNSDKVLYAWMTIAANSNGDAYLVIRNLRFYIYE